MLNSIDNLVERTFFGSPTSFSKFLAAAAVALLTTAGAANAATITATISYGTWTSGSSYKPTISPDPVTFTLPSANNQATSPVNFFTASPVNSSHCYGCTNDTSQGILNVTFTFSGLTPVAGSDLTETATYYAKYSGAALPCATASGSGQTDCVVWEGTTGIGTSLSDTLAISFTNGQTLTITFYDAEDWAITPKISFALDPGTTPLPGALPLFVSGSGLLGLIGLRRKKQMAKKAAV